VLERIVAAFDFEEPIEELRLGHGDPRPGILHEEGDLVGGVGVVDRERRGAEVHRRGVGNVELRPVDEHHRDRVALLQAKRCQAGRGTLDALVVLAPADLDGPVERLQRRPIRDAVGRVLKGARDSALVEPLVVLGLLRLRSHLNSLRSESQPYTRA
jgi:hypothetical protein